MPKNAFLNPDYKAAIKKKIIDDFANKTLEVNGRVFRLNVYSNFSINLSIAYLLTRDALENKNKSKEKLKQNFITITHDDGNGKMINTNVHLKDKLRYDTFPAIYCNKIPNFNGQIIYEYSYEKDKNAFIMATEGPTQKTIGCMLFEACKNNLHTIFSLGTDTEINGHYNYYRLTNTEKLICKLHNGETHTLYVTSKESTLINEGDDIQSYQLTIHIPSLQKENFSLNVVNIKVKDGDALTIANLKTLKAIYDNINNNNVAFHCAAGKNRTAILPMAFIQAREGVFEKDYSTPHQFADEFGKVYASICQKRAILSSNEKQLNQIYDFSFIFTAFKKNELLTDLEASFPALPTPIKISTNKESFFEKEKITSDPVTQTIDKKVYSI